MASNQTQQRRKTYSKLSAQIALLDNAQLQALLDKDQTQNGWGKTQTLKFGKFKVFLKRIPITALEHDNLFSTRNLYALPMYYHYGVGSAGFGVFRELITHLKTTGWVLEGAAASFPLMYHYRILPITGARTEIDAKGHQEYVEYWGGHPSIGQYLRDRASAEYELVIFLEYFPYTVGNWLKENPKKSDILLAEMNEAISIMKAQGIIHLDAHFHNIVTDGNHFYLTDFGLALDKNFALTPEEAAFYRRHTDYDMGEVLSCLGAERLPFLLEQGSAAKYREVIALMNTFFSELRSNPRKDTRFPHAKLRILLREAGTMSLCKPTNLSAFFPSTPGSPPMPTS